MLELEKKHLKAYLKDKKESKKNDKIINENKTSFYRTFNYLTNEYYKNLKKEFLDSEIIKDCDIKDNILIEIKEFLKNRDIAKCEEDKIIINYETVNFLSSLVRDYKIFCLIYPINVLAFITSALAILFSLLDKSALQWLVPITIVIFLFLIGFIIRNIIDKIDIK